MRRSGQGRAVSPQADGHPMEAALLGVCFVLEQCFETFRQLTKSIFKLDMNYRDAIGNYPASRHDFGNGG